MPLAQLAPFSEPILCLFFPSSSATLCHARYVCGHGQLTVSLWLFFSLFGFRGWTLDTLEEFGIWRNFGQLFTVT